MEARERSESQLLKIVIQGRSGSGKSREELYARGWTALMLDAAIEDTIDG